MTIHDIKIGDSASFSKTVSESDVYMFAGITGDLNPAHIDQCYAEKTMFKGRIAHGVLSAGFISTVLGTMLPGPGTIYLGQELHFTSPVRFGDTITATATVTERDEEKNIVKLETVCVNQAGTAVIKGFATVMPPKRAHI